MESNSIMKTLYLERSTGSSRDGRWVETLDLDGVERIVVGTGPGSFAGIRAALAFAQGFALGRSCEVVGLPSPCAIAAQQGGTGALAVVGDARRGKIWIALFDGFSLVRDVFQVDSADVRGSVPKGWPVVSPDAARLGEFLATTFGADYRGGQAPTAKGLRAFAEANPSALVREPRPIYLNPAVREPNVI